MVGGSFKHERLPIKAKLAKVMQRPFTQDFNNNNNIQK